MTALLEHAAPPNGGERSDRDCCVYALHVVRRAYGLARLSAELRAEWMIHPDLEGGAVSASRAWGPVRAAVAAGVADQVRREGTPAPGRWYLCQGWSSLQSDGTAAPARGDRGHTWLWYAAPGGLGIRVDSSRQAGPRVRGWQQWRSLAGVYRAGIHTARLLEAS